jgi:predicted helicase
MEKDNKLAQVFHYDLYGRRSEKYNFLLENDLQTVEWQTLQPHTPYYFFVPKDFSLKEEYEKGFSVSELFTINSSGITTADDINLVSFLPFKENNQPYAYRPFDIRYINYDLKKVQRPRYEVMKNFINKENVGLIFRRSVTNTENWCQIFVSNHISEGNYLSARTYTFPLYLYEDNFGKTEKKPNLNEKIINEISQRLGLQFTDEPVGAYCIRPCETNINNVGVCNTPLQFAPIDVLDYIYAVLHSPSYREKYKEFLKIDFPRVPYPENAEQFLQLVELGGKLRHLHLLEDVESQGNIANYPIAGSNEIEKPQYAQSRHCGFNPQSPANEEEIAGQARNDEEKEVGSVFINDTQYFDNVPRAAWNFYIGGYQPAQKWLKDRKGRKLNFDDIQHYQKIIKALKKTAETMKEIDKIIS